MDFSKLAKNNKKRSRTSSMKKGYSKYRKMAKRRKKYSGSSKNTLLRLPFGNVKISKKFSRNVLVAIVSTIGFFAVVFSVFFLIFVNRVKESMPTVDSITNRDFAEATEIYDRNGVLLYTTYGEENRRYVGIDEVPEHTKWAILAAEDVDFYKHNGIDLPGLVKVGVFRLQHGYWGRGSSTVTQQLIRNTVLVDVLGNEAYKKTISRKFKEILMALTYEQELSKEEILEYYVNVIPLGGPVYGFQSAAQNYFGKDVSELTLAESSLIAGLIQAPGAYSPLYGTSPDYAKVRQEYVLDQVEKYQNQMPITQEEIDAAREEQLVYKQAERNNDLKAPHFTMWVKQLLVEELGEDYVNTSGLKVTTTLNYDMQQVAKDRIRRSIDGVDGNPGERKLHNVHNASLVAMDPKTGEVLTMVGSYDYWKTDDPRVDGNVNIALSPRQMGSAVKPITYLTAFSQGYYPSLITPDIPFNFGNYEPENWDSKFYGHMFLRNALVQSRNLSAVYTAQLIGVDSFIQSSERLGISTLTDRSRYGLSITLGSAEMRLLELTEAYTVFANEGVHMEPTPFLKVEDKDGKELEQFTPQKEGDRVFSEQEIYMLNWVLCNESNQDRFGAQYFVAGGQRLCGKTGTTNGPRDLTSFLYYPNLVVGVWAGNNNNQVTCGIRHSNGDCAGQQGWSTTVPLPIANAFVSSVVGKFDNAWIKRPGGIVDKKVCTDTGLPAGESDCATTTSIFMSNRLPPTDDNHKKVGVCKVNNKPATNQSEAEKMDLIKEVNVIGIPLANEDHQTTWNKWLKDHKKQAAKISGKKKDDFIFNFELDDAEECPLGLGDENAPIVTIESPSEGSVFVVDSEVTVKYSTVSLDPIVSVDVYVDDVRLPEAHLAGDPGSVTFSLEGISAGQHTIKLELVDNGSRAGSQTVDIEVVEPYDIGLSINPIEGQVIDEDYTLNVQVSGDDIAQITTMDVVVTQLGEEQERISMVTEDSITWEGTLEILELPAGEYTLTAYANTNLETYQSGSISITIN
jgi:membrane peptidoglycan carboxypeptidase